MSDHKPPLAADTLDGVVRQWIPCTERLPPEDETVVAYSIAGFNLAQVRDEGQWFYMAGEDDEDYEPWDYNLPTHWLPIPPVQNDRSSVPPAGGG